ncbi:hypothetical protein GCM10008942_28870 [Rhizomicrobium electricum]|uniref:AlpA family transcriptional regulator n=2 Tax=Rhizomicrobium electricum TaxID=480070 RepID=A0ABP3Q2F4_9PROT|nr:AlpA family phage regulatory protein [Rhizomicrobium electricum]NIJ49769.1 prophage regulatory protein [Rhizomicrobium electricum]
MPEPERILRIRTVLTRTGLSRSTIYRKMKDGMFPSQVRISEHCSGWRESEISRWMADPMQYRDAGRKWNAMEKETASHNAAPRSEGIKTS